MLFPKHHPNFPTHLKRMKSGGSASKWLLPLSLLRCISTGTGTVLCLITGNILLIIGNKLMQRMNWTPSSDTNLASLEFVCKTVPMVVIASGSKIDSFSKAKEHGT